MIQKNIISIPFLIVLCVGAIATYTYKKYRIAPKISFPEMEVVSEKKETIKLKMREDKLTVLTFYASWCPDCKREFPKMQKAMETNLSNLDFIAITDEGFEKMIWFKDKYKYPFTFYTIPKSFDEYNIYAIPTTYILNSKNEIIFSKVGDIDWQNLSIR